MRLLISAGEASGELYGAGLIAALRRRVPDISFFGVGGERMRQAGFETIIDAHQITVVGLAEVVTHLPKIYREFHRLLAEVDRRRPDAAILIDFPDFNLRLARQLHRRGIPVIYYVSPQLWAWREGRIAQIRRYVHKMLVIFPFEEAWYRARGVEAEYVGHPLADEPLPTISRQEFAQAHNLDAAKTWIALLPGSRPKEVRLNLSRMLWAASIIHWQSRRQYPSDRDPFQSEYEFILPVAPSLANSDLGRRMTASGQLLEPKFAFRAALVPNAREALLHARAAVVASGTATVETALIGTPFVMVYRVSPLTWLLGRRLVKVDRFAMPNLIAGREVVPELVQKDFTAKNVIRELLKIIPDSPERTHMLAALSEVRQKLLPPTGSQRSATDRAAEAVLRALASQQPAEESRSPIRK